ncbi:hypothetical protein [Trujillonella humicola]|uniref:hypothetical protein n=1 Tax=Trujillonella humicola TaxID=3383699 RepID=UPI00390671A8
MELKVGQTLTSAVDATSLVVVRAPQGDVDVTCGGAPMIAPGQPAAAGVTAQGDPGTGVLMGKRYADEALGLELLCVKPGDYAVAVNGTPLAQKSAQPLPASD